MWPLFGTRPEDQGKMGANARHVRANTAPEPPAGPEGPTEEEEGMRTPPSRSSAAPTSNGSSLLSSKRASSSRRSTGGGNDDGEAAHVVRQPGEGRRAREISPMRRPDDAGPLPDEVPVEEIAAMVERQVSSKSFEPASSGM